VLYFVRTEVPKDKVDEFTERLVNNQMRRPEGNISYVTPDGCWGYDLIECNDESECRRQYDDLTKYWLKIHEITPVMTMGHFLESWQRYHQKAA